MTIKNALEFLSTHQPMPPTAELSSEELAEYDAARKLFLSERDIRCVPLFLNSFGEGDANGIYQLVGDVIRMYDVEFVVPHLNEALLEGGDTVKYWCSQIAEYFPVRAIASSLMKLLAHHNPDIRAACATALSDIEGEDVTLALSLAMKEEKDDDVGEILADILECRN